MLRRRTSLALSIALPLAALLGTSIAPLSAAAQTPEACLTPGAVVTQATLRFNAAAPGNIVATGNSLGLSKADATNGPGLFDSIGTFIALDPTDVDASPAPGWFAGTTNDWTLNGSSAELALPSEVEILHAELVWGGSWADPNGAGSIAKSLDDAVRLIAGGDDIDVAPEGAGIDVSLGTLYRYYARSADVTDFLRDHGEGTYSVAGVPAKQTDAINSLHAAGWTLFVAYRDPQQPIRNLSIFFGGQFVDENTSQDYGFADFCASSAGDLTGRAIITALEGDSNRDGDVLCIAPGESPANTDFVGLAGPNNPANNFFASQINDADGELDVTGTFGDRNHVAAAPAVANAVGGRQGWDIAQINLSSDDGSLAPGQTGAVLRTATLSDSYLPMAAGFAIDVTAPVFPPGPGTASTISTGEVALGDTFTVTVTLTNEGPVAANEIGFRMPLPAGIALEGFTTDGDDGDIDGDAVDAGDLSSGVDAGTLAPGAERVVELTLRVDAPPPGNTYFFQPFWGYSWIMCAGEPPLSETFAGQGVAATFDDQGATSAQSSGNGSGGAGGDSGAGGSPGPVGPGAGGSEAPSTSSGPTVASSSAKPSTSGPSAGPGPAGSGGAPSGGGDGDGDGDAGNGGGNGFSDGSNVTEAEGCGCSAPGGSPDVSWPLAAIALGVVGWRRRRSPHS